MFIRLLIKNPAIATMEMEMPKKSNARTLHQDEGIIAIVKLRPVRRAAKSVMKTRKYTVIFSIDSPERGFPWV